ncbi:MAG TPA: energy-coupling factor transporter transmembrane protein EcfT [Armatimonadetes bacterium]|nr:energy-coupling factor transporter transmembrane protein EcfT [Armatimonadota bacterium]
MMELYVAGDSVLHKLHPTAKVLALLFFFACAVVFTHPIYVLAPLTIAIIGATCARAWWNVWRMRWFLIVLFAFSVVLWSFAMVSRDPSGKVLGHVLWEGKRLAITRESLMYALAMGMRLDAMLISAIIFLTVTRIEEIVHGLCTLGVPYEIAFSFSLAARLVPTLMSSTATVVQAQRSRGLDLAAGNLIARIRKYVPLIVPVFLSTVRNADLLAIALEMRGFSPGKPRTTYLEFRWGVMDAIILITLILVFAVSIALRISGIGITNVA